MGARIRRQERDSSGDTPHQIVGVAIYVASLFFSFFPLFFSFFFEGFDRPRHVASATKPRRLDGVKVNATTGNMSRHSMDTLENCGRF